MTTPAEKSLGEIYREARYERSKGPESFGCRNYVAEEELEEAGLEAVAAHVREQVLKEFNLEPTHAVTCPEVNKGDLVPPAVTQVQSVEGESGITDRVTPIASLPNAASQAAGSTVVCPTCKGNWHGSHGLEDCPKCHNTGAIPAPVLKEAVERDNHGIPYGHSAPHKPNDLAALATIPPKTISDVCGQPIGSFSKFCKDHPEPESESRRSEKEVMANAIPTSSLSEIGHGSVVSPESNPQGEPPVDNGICMGTRDCPCPDCRPVVTLYPVDLAQPCIRCYSDSVSHTDPSFRPVAFLCGHCGAKWKDNESNENLDGNIQARNPELMGTPDTAGKSAAAGQNAAHSPPYHETDEPDASADGPLEPEKFRTPVTPRHRETARNFYIEVLSGEGGEGPEATAAFVSEMAQFFAVHFPAHDPVKESLRRQLVEYDQMRNDLTAALLKIQELQHLMAADRVKEKLAEALQSTKIDILRWNVDHKGIAMDRIDRALAAYEAERKS